MDDIPFWGHIAYFSEAMAALLVPETVSEAKALRQRLYGITMRGPGVPALGRELEAVDGRWCFRNPKQPAGM